MPDVTQLTDEKDGAVVGGSEKDSEDDNDEARGGGLCIRYWELNWE